LASHGPEKVMVRRGHFETCLVGFHFQLDQFTLAMNGMDESPVYQSAAMGLKKVVAC